MCKTIVFIPDYDLSSTPLDPTETGFMMSGTVDNDYLGYALSTAGDINGDGYADMIVGAYGKESSKGYVYVIYGGPNFSLSYANLDLTTLDPTATGFLIKGNAAGDKLGYSVSFAGKVNDDAYDDIIIGAPGQASSKGIAYVIYGGPTNTRSNIDLATITLAPLVNGFSLTGEATGDNFGWTVNTAGNVDNDGYDDMIIGAARKGSNTGAAYVIYGKKNSQRSSLDLATTSLGSGSFFGFRISGTASGDYLGATLSTAGKLNNDDYDDIIIGAFGWNSFQGAAYVIYGGEKSSCQNIDLATTPLNPTTTGFTMKGIAGTSFGKSVDSLGDINQDGYNDIVVDAYSGHGVVYVIYGKEASLLSDIDLTVTTLDPKTTGFTITDTSYDGHIGFSTRKAGDVNGDGFPDIIAGADLYQSMQGAAYVVYGGKNSDMVNIDLSVTLEDSGGFMLIGNAIADDFGYTVNRAGDVNGDGYDDIMVGAYKKNSQQGAAYVIYSSCVMTDTSSSTCEKRVFCESCKDGYHLTNTRCSGCPANCQEYSGLTTCQVCDLEYYLVSPTLCGNCPSHCQQCEDSVSCEICNSGYFFYQSECFNPCPGKMFGDSSDSTCKSILICYLRIIFPDCPKHCSSCTSESECQTCDKGYFLSNSLCAKSSSTLKTASTTLEAISNGVNIAGGVLSIGSSLFPVTKLVSKIVQNTRYIGLIVTDELNQVYQDWNTNLINVDIPDAFSSLVEFKSLSSEFSRYNLSSAFLVNFWSNLVFLGAIVGAWIMSHLLKKLMEGGWGFPLVSRIAAGLFNLMLVQAYGFLDDVIFYFILDVQTNPFDNVFSWASFFSGLGFIGVAAVLILFNIVIVKRYQRIKLRNENIETFNENNKRWELFYGDFNDDDILSHSFLAILAVRNCLSSVIISGFYNYPLLQTSVLIILDGAIIIILMTLKPLGELSAKIAQYFYELVALFVHFCTFILAMEGDQVSVEKVGKILFCKTIIFLNYALIIGGICLMLVEIYKSVSSKIKTWKLKQKNQGKNVNLEDSVNQSVLSTKKPLDLSITALNPSTEINPREPWVNIRRGRIQRHEIESDLNFERPFGNKRIAQKLQMKTNLHFEQPPEKKRREDSPSNNPKRGAINSNNMLILKEKKKRKEALIIAKAKQNFNFNY